MSAARLKEKIVAKGYSLEAAENAVQELVKNVRQARSAGSGVTNLNPPKCSNFFNKVTGM